jgi:hypothetical protein
LFVCFCWGIFYMFFLFCYVFFPFFSWYNILLMSLFLLQTTSSPFNRGMLSNIGFVEFGLDMHYDCLVIHDVDVLPEDDRNFYVCRSDPIHMSTLVEQFEYV